MQKNLNQIIAFLLVVMVSVLFIPTTTVYAASAKDITYTTKSGKEVDFSKSDFNNVCKSLNDEKLDYVKFSLPSSSKGRLYYDYDDDKKKVDKDDKYYYSESRSISDVTFVPKNDYSGTVTIDYTGRDVKKKEFKGSVKVTVGSDGSDGKIKYSVDPDDTVNLKKADFNNYCNYKNLKKLDYMFF